MARLLRLVSIRKEACSGGGNPYPTMVSLEERYAHKIFERPYAAAHSRLSHAKHPGRTTKAQTLSDKQRLCDRDEIESLRSFRVRR
jgi:hypothetical protein